MSVSFHTVKLAVGRTVLAFTLAAAIPQSAHSTDTGAIADAEVRACLDHTLAGRSMIQHLRVEVADATGAVRPSSGTLHWKRFDDALSKLHFRIDKSAQYQGVALLMEERPNGAEPRTYMFSPELGREKRISGGALAGPLLGTDFSYEDFALLQHIGTTGDMRRLADAETAGRAVYVVENQPDPDESSYSRVVTFLDKQWCVPLRTEFYAPNGSLAKQMVIAPQSIQESGTRAIPSLVTMTNHKDKSTTRLVVEQSEFDSDIPDNRFSVAGLRKGR